MHEHLKLTLNKEMSASRMKYALIPKQHAGVTVTFSLSTTPQYISILIFLISLMSDFNQ